MKWCGDATSYTHPALLKKKRLIPKAFVILCCCQFLTAILFYCNAAMLFGTLLFHFVTYQTAKPNTQSIAIKKTVIPTTTTIPLLQYKNCQKHT
jgi:hypothetical protein